ncbi:MAG: isoaspartyl peptidase/L-asparaginase [Acidobacteriaceae bacterium]
MAKKSGGSLRVSPSRMLTSTVTVLRPFRIRYTVARTICALVQYKHMRLQAAADEVIQKQLAPIHGEGGVIAITPNGQTAWSFNTPGMFRAKWKQGTQPQIAIYSDER